MPYIVTVTERQGRVDLSWEERAQGYREIPGWEPIGGVTRRAVTSLDGARNAVGYALDAACHTVAGSAGVHDFRVAAHSLPESGGTIGPLPDGTTITVELLDWSAFGKLAWDLVFPDAGEDEVNTTNGRALIDAYNAAQVAA